ncbi:MAG TPA: TolC family protein [Spirochaetota bacterium]|nr:TolC family protein [Spirochaetota bacterium]HPC41491.1 TolC family protein [Spirochaetota bacterium]HPL15622.1 TolC family protein [Spirochaetota bacterium]HQF09141.1 TolC family protein [Spirochaetota bacterium]HQH97634.1 TolC family protein [Spirochaetota bacterium]
MKKLLKHAVLACVVLGVSYGAGAQQVKDNRGAAAVNTDMPRAVVDDKARLARESRPIKIDIAEEPALVLGSMKITLSQAIVWAVKQNYDALAVSYEVAMLDTQYNRFLTKFSPYLVAEAGAAYSRNVPSQKTFAGIDVTQAKVSAGVAKKFMSGTTVVGGVEYEYDAFNRKSDLSSSLFSSMYGPSHPHKPGVFIQVQQELLKNAFGINDQRTREILNNESKKQKDKIVFLLSLVVVQVIGEYWNTVMDKISLENAELQVRETKKVRDTVARNAAYGLADDYTLGMYNSMLAGAEAKLVMARQKYRESLRAFLTTINVDENMDVTGTAVFTTKYPPVNVEEALKTAYQKRVDYINAVRDLETAQLGLKIAENNSLPSLVASISGRLTSENNSFSDAFTKDLGQVKYPQIQGKLAMTYPIGQEYLYIKERNARFRIKQAQLQLDKYRRTVKDEILNSSDNIDASYRLYQKAVEARKQSEIFYRGMLRDLGLGRLNSAIAKNGLDAMVQSREMELQALVKYNVSLLQFDVARNILFEKYGIDVDQYIPKDVKK